MSMPRAKGLFRRAIAQSGAGHHVISTQTAQHMSEYLAKKLGVEPTQEGITSVPYPQLLQAQVELSGDVFNNPNPELWGEAAANLMPFEPVIDGDLIPARPIDRIVAGAGAEIDLMVGTNLEEQRLMMVPNGAIDHITDQVLAGTVMAYGLPETTLAIYHATRSDASAGDLLAAIVTDWFYRIPALRLAEAHTASPLATYMYEFAWRSPKFDKRLGACHDLEVAFVFDNLDQPENEPLTGSAPPQQLANRMHAAWVAFATDGDPGWPKFDLDRRATMHFDTKSEVINDPRSAERALWQGIR